VADVEDEFGAVEVEGHLKAIAVEDQVLGLDSELRQFLGVHPELAEGALLMRAGPHLLLVVEQREPGREGHIDAARIVAVDEPVMAVGDVGQAVDVIGEEGLQDAQIVDLLQDQEIGTGFRDCQSAQLALVVLQRYCNGALHHLAFFGLLHVEEGQGRTGLRPLLRPEAVAGGKVLDVEGADAKAHGRT
jgi:hypothetical protein